jgi:hypothetical protein
MQVLCEFTRISLFGDKLHCFPLHIILSKIYNKNKTNIFSFVYSDLQDLALFDISYMMLSSSFAYWPLTCTNIHKYSTYRSGNIK